MCQPLPSCSMPLYISIIFRFPISIRFIMSSIYLDVAYYSKASYKFFSYLICRKVFCYFIVSVIWKAGYYQLIPCGNQAYCEETMRFSDIYIICIAPQYSPITCSMLKLRLYTLLFTSMSSTRLLTSSFKVSILRICCSSLSCCSSSRCNSYSFSLSVL